MSVTSTAWSGERVLAVLSAGNLQRLPEIKRRLLAVAPRADVIAPTDLEHLGSTLQRSHRVYAIVLAVGGDGWLHRVLQHLDLASQILGVVPAGTGNDLARAIGCPQRLAPAIIHLANTAPQATDYGLINGVRYINSAGFGLDSATLHTRHTHRGFLNRNYLAAFVYSLARLQPLAGKINIDGEELEDRFMWVLAMNSPFIGGGTRIAPHASLSDGLLDVLLVRTTSKLELLGRMPDAVRGKHLGMQAALYRQARRVDCEMRQPVNTLAVDGEELFSGSRQVSFSVVAGGLQMLR